MYELIAEYEDLYQEKIGGPFMAHDHEEIVALFTSLEKASTYVRKARLKKPGRRSFGSPQPFRCQSLLSNAVSVRIEPHMLDAAIIDPEL